MNNFEPSGDFINAVMNGVRRYEFETRTTKEQFRALLCSRPVVLTLCTAGMLLGLFNAVRMALILISPARCF